MAAADAFSASVFTVMLSSFEETITGAITNELGTEGLFLLRMFGTIELATLCAWWALSDEGNKILASVFMVGVKVGVFVMLITRMAELSKAFADGAVWLGLMVGGTGGITLAQFKDPGAIMLSGWKLFIPIFQYFEDLGKIGMLLHTGAAAYYGAGGFVGWACILFIGVHIIIAWVELWIITGVAICFLPWGILRFTNWIGEGVIVSVVSAGIRLGVLAAMVSLIVPVMGKAGMTDPNNPSYSSLMGVVGVAFIFAILTWSLPRFMGKIVTGSQGFTGSSVMGMAIGVKHLVGR